MAMPFCVTAKSGAPESADISKRGVGCLLCAMYGRRPQCKGKESDLSRNDTGAAMYPAFECSRCGCWP
jgi:hypothetical protein